MVFVRPLISLSPSTWSLVVMVMEPLKGISYKSRTMLVLTVYLISKNVSVCRTFLGSVSDYCAHHAKCPIIIVRKKSSDAAKSS